MIEILVLLALLVLLAEPRDPVSPVMSDALVIQRLGRKI